MPRDMTDDERRRFENVEVHHRNQEEPEDAPASEAHVVRDTNPPKPETEAPMVPPNPD